MQTTLKADVISARLDILAKLDSSPEVSFMERARFRLRVFGIVEALDRGDITSSTAADRLTALRREIGS